MPLCRLQFPTPHHESSLKFYLSHEPPQPSHSLAQTMSNPAAPRQSLRARRPPRRDDDLVSFAPRPPTPPSPSPPPETTQSQLESLFIRMLSSRCPRKSLTSFLYEPRTMKTVILSPPGTVRTADDQRIAESPPSDTQGMSSQAMIDHLRATRERLGLAVPTPPSSVVPGTQFIPLAHTFFSHILTSGHLSFPASSHAELLGPFPDLLYQ